MSEVATPKIFHEVSKGLILHEIDCWSGKTEFVNSCILVQCGSSWLRGQGWVHVGVAQQVATNLWSPDEVYRVAPDGRLGLSMIEYPSSKLQEHLWLYETWNAAVIHCLWHFEGVLLTTKPGKTCIHNLWKHRWFAARTLCLRLKASQGAESGIGSVQSMWIISSSNLILMWKCPCLWHPVASFTQVLLNLPTCLPVESGSRAWCVTRRTANSLLTCLHPKESVGNFSVHLWSSMYIYVEHLSISRLSFSWFLIVQRSWESCEFFCWDRMWWHSIPAFRSRSSGKARQVCSLFTREGRPSA